MFDEIIEQLRCYCDCIGDLDTDNLDKRSKVEKDLAELIRLVSISTCWASGEMPKFKKGCECHELCDTFLMSPREEVLDPQDINDLCSACDGGLMKYDLFYSEIVPDSITVDIIYRDGIQFESVPFGEYAFDPYVQCLWLDLSGYIPSATCSCRQIYKLVIRYDAGFERLPECLLPVFCELFQYVQDMNRCDCEACQACDTKADSEEPDEQEQKDIWMWVRQHMYETWARQLEVMSLCSADHGYWGEVV